VIGKTIGPYQVVAKLGEGGMGEVYRAHDTRLGRDVALKILPDAFARDAERLARFRREAQVLASLNHPNIAQIHGLEDSDGTHALVMELVEGPTLADRIAQGPMPVDEVLPIAKQIAQALEAAHQQGIIHRDLKPANIKLKGAWGPTPTRLPDGRLEPTLSASDVAGCTVKVLDFGLAKAATPTPEGPGLRTDLANSPTITSPAMTEIGMILGTAPYMAPEQAKGRAVDKRADIWAFGAVLYEMLTGQRAFAAADVSDTLAAVLRADVRFEALPDETPARVRQVLAACLQRDPTQRVHDIADARLALDGAFETVAPTPTGTAPTPRRMLLAVGAAGVVGGGLLALAAVWWSAHTRPPATAPVERVSLVAPANRPVNLGWYPGRSLALSPDGTKLVYVAATTDAPAGQSALALRSLDSREVRDLPGTAGARQPFFSPDGRWVAFFTLDGGLKKVSLAGGNPLTVADGINGSQWGSGVWLDDGTIVFGVFSSSGLRRVSADGGTVATLITPPENSSYFLPALVPSTPAVLFTTFRNMATARIEALRLDTGERHVVVDNGWNPVVLGGASLLFQRADTAVVAPFDVRSLTITGPAVPFTEDVRSDSPQGVFPLAEWAASRRGAVAYLPAEAEPPATLGLVSRDGTFQPLGVPPGAIRYPRVAPDGHAVAFIEGPFADSHVRVYDLTRGSTTTRGQEDAILGPAVWRPGTGALAVGGRKGDVAGVYLDDPDGSEHLILRPPPGQPPVLVKNIAWSPDGTELAYTTQTGSQFDIWILTPGGEPASTPLVHTTAAEYSPAFSPDGHWLAYQSDQSGRFEVYVRRYPQGEAVPVSVAGGRSPVWQRDGRQLFFAGPQDRLWTVSVTPDHTSLRLGTPVALFDLATILPSGERVSYDPHPDRNNGVPYDVLPDGRFAMVRSSVQSTAASEIVLMRH
jgi:eukaryotic-like serine/threonine-protein kinase